MEKNKFVHTGYGHSAKKSLGQNFLKSEKAIREIVWAGELGVAVPQGQACDTVLEIGPGLGVLTRALLEKGARVVAIEKDDRLVIPLSIKFAKEIQSGQFTLIHGDVLDFVSKDAMLSSLKKLLGQTYKLIANIPYYITGEIIERFHTIPNSPSLMVLLVQKEVAERIIGKSSSTSVKLQRDKKESILSIAVKMYGNPKIVSIVPRGAFTPSPNVDSAILSITNIKHFGTLEKEKSFFKLLHASFAHKRKYMLSNIKILPESIQNKVKKILNKHNYKDSVRAEDIPIEIWREMS